MASRRTPGNRSNGRIDDVVMEMAMKMVMVMVMMMVVVMEIVMLGDDGVNVILTLMLC